MAGVSRLHGTGITIAALVLACDLAVDVADEEDGYTYEDEIDDDFLEGHDAIG